MHILLTVLAVIGRVIGILLLILLLLLLALLLIPIRYRFRIEKPEKGGAAFSFLLSWLIRFITISGERKADGALTIRFCIFGFTVRKIEKSGKKGEDPATEDPATEDPATDTDAASEMTFERKPGHFFRGRAAQEDLTTAQETDRKKRRTFSLSALRTAARDQRSSQAETSKREKEPAAGRRLSERLFQLLGWLCDTLLFGIVDQADKIEAQFDRFSKQMDRWITMENEAAIRFIIRRLVIALRHYKPRYVTGSITFGAGRPDRTGYLMGLLAVLLPAGAGSYRVEPDFYTARFETDTGIRGHLRLIHLAAAVLAILLHRSSRQFLLRLLRGRKGGKHG